MNEFKLCKLVFHVDGTWLYREYKVMVVAHDRNRKTIPIAFAIRHNFYLKNIFIT